VRRTNPINHGASHAAGGQDEIPGIGGSGAPTTTDYLVKTADAGLSAERVVTDTTSITVDWSTAGQAKFQRAALTGDVTASANSNATTIANDAVTYAKMQTVSASDKVLGRSTAGSGDVEEITCTPAGRALLDDASAAAQLVTLGVAGTLGAPFRGAGAGTAAAFSVAEWHLEPAKQSWSSGVAVAVETGIPATNGDYFLRMDIWIQRVLASHATRKSVVSMILRRTGGTLALIGATNTLESEIIAGFATTPAWAVSGDDLTVTITSVGNSGYLSVLVRGVSMTDMTSP
jgi:hypothetical protein